MSIHSKAIFDYIFGLTGSDVKLEMSRVEQFMAVLGHPHKAYPVVHIAGTNGKGSTAAILAAMLQGYGYRVGLFTSPHLITPNERIRVNDQMVPDAFIVQKVDEWRTSIEALGITFFEVLTALGMVYFKEQQVDFCVLETGLGGRLDATNVVDPLLSMITSISRDHENILGSTIQAITMEKAGIIKPGRPLVLGKNSNEIQDTIAKVCSERKAPYAYAPDMVETQLLEQTLTGQLLKASLADSEMTLRLPLLGSHQIDNFTTALAALSILDLRFESAKIQTGLADLNWAGRMEILKTGPTILYDVAHNPDGLSQLMQSLNDLGLGDAILLPAFNARKDIREMVRLLKSWPGPVLYTLFEGHSSVDKEVLKGTGVLAKEIVPSVPAALEYALQMRAQNQALCFFGSHYLAEEIYPIFDSKHESSPS